MVALHYWQPGATYTTIQRAFQCGNGTTALYVKRVVATLASLKRTYGELPLISNNDCEHMVAQFQDKHKEAVIILHTVLIEQGCDTVAEKSDESTTP
jgi:hypothetical protein